MRHTLRALHARIQHLRGAGMFPDFLQKDYRIYRLMDGWPLIVPD